MIRTLIKPFSLAVMLLLGLLSPIEETLAAASRELAPIRLQLRWLHQFQFAGYYAAKHKGFYQAHGLDVSIEAGSPERAPVQEVLSGRATYGVANAELIFHYLKGAPLVALAAIFQHSPSVLLVRADSGIRNPHNLVGQSIMLYGGENDFDVLAMFRREGIDTTQLDIRPSSFNVQDLVDGKIDAFNAYLTNEPFYLEAQGIEPIIIDPDQYGIDFYTDILFTTQEELKKHPERVRAFREASIKGWEYALTHKEEIIDLILKEYRLDKSREHLVYEADAAIKLIQPKAVGIGHMNLGRFELMAGTMIETNLVDRPRPLKGLLYDPDPKFDRESLLTMLQVIAVLLFGSLVLTLVVLRFNQRLNREIFERKEVETQLKEQHELQVLLNDLAFELLYVPQEEMDQAFERLLQKAGKHLGVDRINLCRLDEGGETFSCTQEWCAHNIAPIWHQRQKLPVAAAWWWQHSGQREILQIDDLAAASDAVAFAEGILGTEELKSLMAAPLQYRDQTHGVIAIHSIKASRQWTANEAWFLESLAYVLASALARWEVTENLRQARDFAENLITSATVIILVLESDGSIQSFNPYLESLSGYTLAEMQGKQWTEHFLPDSAKSKVQQIMQEAGAGTVSQGIINPIRTKDGRELMIEWRNQPLFDQQGTPVGILAIGQDVTSRLHSEEQLQLAASVFTHAQEGICITSADGTILDVNEAFSRITGYPRAEALGQNTRLLKSGRHEIEFYQDLWTDLIDHGQWSGEIWNRRKNGEIYPELLTISEVLDREGQIGHYVAIFTEISAIKAYEEQLKLMAHYDTLTGLPNRALVTDRLQQTMIQHERRELCLAVAFIDLDGFKEVNDTYGHEVGDQLLVALASRMRHALREGDTIGRLGGDEFIALIIDLCVRADSTHLLDRLLKAASTPVRVGDLELQVSASIGVSFYPQDRAANADELLRQADMAMYEAKRGGKNRYVLSR